MTLFGPEPIRGELLSVERLEQLAESFARHRVSDRESASAALLARVKDNGRVLLRCYRALAAVIHEERATMPAAEWLVDNFYIVEDVLNEVRTDLPPGFYRQLPTLIEGPLREVPRAVGLAWTYIEHTDSRFEPASLRRFVEAFQRVEPLLISEVWAVPIALRLTLIENLRRLAVEIVEGRGARLEADRIAAVLLGHNGLPPDPQAFARLGDEVLTSAYAVQLVQRLRDQDPNTTPALVWLEKRLAAAGTPAEELVRAEYQRQGAANVTVRNVITSLRVMATFDWRDFFESVSLVDRILRAESEFGAMDFATRDRYRKAVEDLARGSRRTEMEVARAALGLARAHAPGAEDPGHYLISRGRSRLEEALGYRIRLRQHLVRAYVASATWSYLGSIAIVTASFLCLPLLYTGEQGIATGLLVALAAFALFPASDVAIALVNRAVMEVFPPRALPRLALVGGVPSRFKTLVAVPILLTGEAQIAEQVRASVSTTWPTPRAPCLRNSLRLDRRRRRHAPGDEHLLDLAQAGIDELNRQHGPAEDGESRFHLLHRRRVWARARASGSAGSESAEAP
jgi:cyclic beta-1,2-glucan synthetase